MAVPGPYRYSPTQRYRRAMALRILLLSSVFPPVNATGARRPYFMARQLRDMGHTVTVLTNDRPEPHPWTADLGGIHRIALPMTHLPEGMSGWQIALAHMVHALGRMGPQRPARWIADLLLPLDHGHRWGPGNAALAERVGEQDVVIATGPRWSMLERGAALARTWNASFIADYRDPWNVVMPEVALHTVTHAGRGALGRWRRARRLAMERRCMAHATAITAATPTVLENAARVTGLRRGEVIYNGTEPSPARPATRSNERFTILYTGSAYREQEWPLVAEAIDRLQREHPQVVARSRLVFVGTHADKDPALAALGVLLNEAPLVERLDRMAPAAIRDLQQHADALLHVGFAGKEGILPLKFIEYLDAGPPVWQVSSGRSIQEDVLERTRAGSVLPTAQAIVDLWTEQHEAWRMGHPVRPETDQEVLATFHWTHQMTRFEAFMREVHRQHQEELAAPEAK